MGAVRASTADSPSIAVFSTRVAMAAGGSHGAQTRHALLVPQRLEFVRRAGKQHNDSRLSRRTRFPATVPALCRGNWAARSAPSQNVGLLGIVLRHLNATFGKALVHRGDDVVIALQLNAQRGGHALAREVVFGRTQTSHEDGDVGAADRGACHRGEMVEIVADDGLEGDDDAQIVETAGEEKGIACPAGTE